MPEPINPSITSPDYSNAAEAQEKYLKTNVKMIEVLKEAMNEIP